MSKVCDNNSSIINNRIRLLALVMNMIMIFVHLMLILHFDGSQIGDAPEYISLAKRVLGKTGFYPVASDFVGVRYIHNPGMVNYLALLFMITQNLRIVFLMNLCFVQVILFSTRFILNRITGKITLGYIYQIIFCIYFSLGVAGGIVSAGVEYTFTALTFMGIALAVTDREWAWILSGITLALANYVRPIFAFVLIPLIVLIFCIKLSNRLKRTIMIVLGIVVTASVIALVSFQFCGRPVYQATTMWSVIIVGNNPIADGNNTTTVFEEGNYGYVSPEESKGWTCDDYDARNKELVIEWVRNNPGKALSLIPKRLFYFWAVDTYFISAFSNNIEPADKTEYMLDIVNKVLHLEFNHLSFTQYMCIITQFVYMLILVLGLIAVILQIRMKDWRRYCGIYMFLLLGNAAYAVTYGCARYHFMYMVTIMMLIPSLATNSINGLNKEMEES